MRISRPKRLQKLVCPGCQWSVILEPAAKQGDVILCPACQDPLIIDRLGDQLKLNQWRETPQRVT